MHHSMSPIGSSSICEAVGGGSASGSEGAVWESRAVSCADSVTSARSAAAAAAAAGAAAGAEGSWRGASSDEMVS